MQLNIFCLGMVVQEILERLLQLLVLVFLDLND